MDFNYVVFFNPVFYEMLPKKVEKKVELPDGFDGSLYPEGQETVPKRLAIVRANQYAVKHSGYLIAYAWQPGSNARKVVEGAGKTKHITIINNYSHQ